MLTLRLFSKRLHVSEQKTLCCWSKVKPQSEKASFGSQNRWEIFSKSSLKILDFYRRKIWKEVVIWIKSFLRGEEFARETTYELLSDSVWYSFYLQQIDNLNAINCTWAAYSFVGLKNYCYSYSFKPLWYQRTLLKADYFASFLTMSVQIFYLITKVQNYS